MMISQIKPVPNYISFAKYFFLSIDRSNTYIIADGGKWFLAALKFEFPKVGRLFCSEHEKTYILVPYMDMYQNWLRLVLVKI